MNLLGGKIALNTGLNIDRMMLINAPPFYLFHEKLLKLNPPFKRTTPHVLRSGSPNATAWTIETRSNHRRASGLCHGCLQNNRAFTLLLLWVVDIARAHNHSIGFAAHMPHQTTCRDSNLDK